MIPHSLNNALALCPSIYALFPFPATDIEFPRRDLVNGIALTPAHTILEM